jgi:hypothetical protein
MSKKYSKWIKEIEVICDKQASGEDAFYTMEEILLRIDSLLFRAMLEAESTTLSDDIESELNGE